MKQIKTQSRKSRLAFPGYSKILVVIGAMILFFSGPGQTYNVSVFINSYTHAQGWSRSLVSGMYSGATLAAGLLLPFMGGLIDRYGHRRMTVMIAGLLAIACLWMSNVSALWMLPVGFLMIRLLGQGSMTLLSSTLIPQWFVRKRGIALSLAAVGGVAGSALIPLISTKLILTFGASFAWRFWGFLLAGLMIPVAAFLIRDKPDDIGMTVDGRMAYEMEMRHTGKLSEKTAEVEWTPTAAMRTRTFWMMLFCMVVPSMINTGITFHMVSIINEKGLHASFGALVLSVTAMIQLPVTFLAGWISDRFPLRAVKAANFLVLCGAMLLLMYGSGKSMLMFYALLHGFFAAMDSVTTNMWWPNYFGRHHLGKIRGAAMTAMVIGSALGPLPFGIAFDLWQRYTEIMWIMLVFPLLASLAAMASPVPVSRDIG